MLNLLLGTLYGSLAVEAFRARAHQHPAAAGAYTFTVRLLDSAGAETWQTFRLTVYPSGSSALRVMECVCAGRSPASRLSIARAASCPISWIGLCTVVSGGTM